MDKYEKFWKKKIQIDIKDFIDETCYEKEKFKSIKTCLITDEKIDNISYFLAHKLPKCLELKINLESIKDGTIIGRGAFGYSFLVTNRDKKKIIIKIVICDKIKSLIDKDETSDDKIIGLEIFMHKLISRYDKINRFAKLYGSFNIEKNKSLFRETNEYIYKNNNDEIICRLPTKTLGNECEIYLFIEAGDMDLKKYMLQPLNNLDELEEFTKLFYDFMEFYKISESFLSNKKVIFVHSDIKPENMIYVIDEFGNKRIKLIDFGVSYISTKFYEDEISGTPYIYNILFGRNNKHLRRSSILFDIFSAVIAYIQIIIYKITAYNIDESKKRGDPTDEIPYDISVEKLLFTDILIKFKELTDGKFSEDIKNKIQYIILLGRYIYNFFYTRITIYNDNILLKEDINLEDKIKIYDSLIDINEFIIKDVVIPSKKLIKLEEQYTHIDRMIQYILNSDSEA